MHFKLLLVLSQLTHKENPFEIEKFLIIGMYCKVSKTKKVNHTLFAL
jgi:hypothetical protein